MTAKSRSTLAVGDLVARVEAPTMIHRVTERFTGYVRILPYRRSGREQLLHQTRHAHDLDRRWLPVDRDGARLITELVRQKP